MREELADEVSYIEYDTLTRVTRHHLSDAPGSSKHSKGIQNWG